MGLNCTVGGARGMFEGRFATEVAGLLDQAFGAEGDWEGTAPRGFGEMEGTSWAEFRQRAAEEMGRDEIPNLLALGDEGRGVYLPANVRAVTLPLSAGNLRCASLPGLRRELADLAERWELPVETRGWRRSSAWGTTPTTDSWPTPPRSWPSPAWPWPRTRPPGAIARSGWSGKDLGREGLDPIKPPVGSSPRSGMRADFRRKTTKAYRRAPISQPSGSPLSTPASRMRPAISPWAKPHGLPGIDRRALPMGSDPLGVADRAIVGGRACDDLSWGRSPRRDGRSPRSRVAWVSGLFLGPKFGPREGLGHKLGMDTSPYSEAHYRN